MKIIVGLGNPGKKYVHTRHNVGFMLLDTLSKEEQLIFKKSFKMKALLARKSYKEEVLFVKPTTFMNNSGEVIQRLLTFYKTPLENFLIVHDDMDLELGRMKFVRKGSSAGHKGVVSIIETAGTEKINRLRIGISKHTKDAVEYVLTDFLEEERKIIPRVLKKAACACKRWISHGSDYVMQTYNIKEVRCNGKIL